MSGWLSAAIRRAEFTSRLLDDAPSHSRAQELVASGLIDRAAQIAELAHSLTDSAIAAMQSEILERGCCVSLTDLRSLRAAAFEGIAHNILDRVEIMRVT